MRIRCYLVSRSDRCARVLSESGESYGIACAVIGCGTQLWPLCCDIQQWQQLNPTRRSELKAYLASVKVRVVNKHSEDVQYISAYSAYLANVKVRVVSMHNEEV